MNIRESAHALARRHTPRYFALSVYLLFLHLFLYFLPAKHLSSWFPLGALYLMQRPLATDTSALRDNLQQMRLAF